MKRLFLIAAMVLMMVSTALAGNIFIEEGDLFIATSLNNAADLKNIPVGKGITAKVEDAKAMHKLGFKDVKVGREILLLNDGGGKWRLKLVSTGEEIAVKLK